MTSEKRDIIVELPKTAIVILDDDATTRLTLEGNFSRSFPQTEVHVHEGWATVGPQLFRLTRAELLTLLVCDLKMPDIKGSDFCAIVRRTTPMVRLLIHTGEQLHIARRALETAGIKDVKVFIKNSPTEELLELVMKMLTGADDDEPPQGR